MVCSRTRVRKIVGNFVVRLRQKGLPVEQVYLFGSYAWGKPTATSDIDIAVVSPKFTRWSDIRRIEVLSDVARYIYPDLDVEIDAVGFTTKELENAPYFNLAAEIRQKGRLVYNTKKSSPQQKS